MIFFIPVIPIGRRRIICECRSCRRHRLMPLGDYWRLQERAAQSQSKLQKSPADFELAKESLGACVSMRDLERFRQIASIIEQHQRDNHDSMMLLAEAYAIFKLTAHSERVLKTAQQVKDDADQGKLDEAETYVEHIIREIIPDRVGLLYRLAQHFQIKANHQKALEYFQHCADVAPGIVDDEVFVKLRAASEKGLRTSKRILPAEVANGTRAVRFGSVLAAAIVILIAAYTVSCFYLGDSRRVYVVSGVNRPYTVSVDGKPYPLSPFAICWLTLSEGEHTIFTRGLAKDLPEKKINIQSNFFSRPFSDELVIINPDQCAVISHEITYYSQNPRGGDRATYSAGEMVSTFRDVDYPFTKFPSQISTSSVGDVKKTGVRVVGADGGAEVDRDRFLPFFKEALPADVLGQIAMRRVECEGTSEVNLAMAANLVAPEKLMPFLHAGASRRPIDLQFHRTYQSMNEWHGKSQELATEYEQLLAKDPDDPNLRYLLARVIADPFRSRELLIKSAKATKPCGYALRALAYQCMASGNYSEALEWIDKVPANMIESSREMRVGCLVALGRSRTAMEILKGRENAPFPMCLDVLWNELSLYGAMKEQAAGEAVISRLAARMGDRDDPEVKEWRQYAIARLAYVMGDLPRFHTLARDSKTPSLLIESSLIRGQLAEAESTRARPKRTRLIQPWPALLRFARETRKGRPTTSERCLPACGIAP